MRHEELEKKHIPMNLHFFGHDGGDGSGAGGDDQDVNKDETDKDGDGGDEDDGDEDPQEKKYSEAEMESAIEKRLNRERRKWQRERQQKAGTGTGGKPKPGADNGADDGGEESEADMKARKAEERAQALEMKWTCLEHDVKKDCVDDVLALARVHMAKEDDLDIEDAIDKVLKKYPQFKDGYDDDGDDTGGQGKKGWGQRHGKPPQKAATVEDEIRKQMFGK